MIVSWRAVEGDVYMPVEEAEWWGASLGILVGAIHHPEHLRDEQPDTNPIAVAREVMAQVEALRAAAVAAGGQVVGSHEPAARSRASVRRERDDVVFCPGVEVSNLAWCLWLFARAALDPAGKEAVLAKGATAYAASAWSRDIGIATGTLPASSRAIGGDAP